ncbi:MAG TPA: hypothetical protein VIV11_23285 [Kofleriaceae bacterium]
MRTLLLLLAGTALAPPPLAEACDCSGMTLARARDRASVAFIGTITKRQDSKTCTTPKQCERVHTYTVKVDGVYKGKVGKTVTVETRPDGKCGAFGDLRTLGKQWLFFSQTAEPYRLSVCNGTTVATKVRLAEANKQLGTAESP